MTWRRAAAALAAFAALAALAGCGLPVDRSPQAIDQREIPQALTDPSPSVSPTTTTIPVSNAAPVRVYFTSPFGIIGQSRELHKPVTLQASLVALESGPSSSELKERIGTALPAAADLTDLGVSHGVASIELDPSFNSIGGTQSIDAIAQIVFTATFLPGIKAVRFVYQGYTIPTENEDGILIGRPVTRADYSALAAE